MNKLYLVSERECVCVVSFSGGMRWYAPRIKLSYFNVQRNNGKLLCVLTMLVYDGSVFDITMALITSALCF